MKTAQEIINKQREMVKVIESDYQEALEAVERAIESLEKEVLRTSQIYSIDELVLFDGVIPEVLVHEITEAGFQLHKNQYDMYWHISIRPHH